MKQPLTPEEKGMIYYDILGHHSKAETEWSKGHYYPAEYHFGKAWGKMDIVKRFNPVPRKGIGTRTFGGKVHYYAGRTIYSSKAGLIAQELAEQGIKTRVTMSRGMRSLLWTDKPVRIDLSEPIYPYNPTKNPKWFYHLYIKKTKDSKWEFCGEYDNVDSAVADAQLSRAYDYRIVRKESHLRDRSDIFNPILPEIGSRNPGLQLPKLKSLPADVKLKEEYKEQWRMTWRDASGKYSSVTIHADTQKDAERKARLYYRRAIALGLTNPILPDIGSGIVAGIGIGTGWKIVDHVWDKVKGKNPGEYQCVICRKTFPTLASMVEHLKKVHKVRPSLKNPTEKDITAILLYEDRYRVWFVAEGYPYLSKSYDKSFYGFDAMDLAMKYVKRLAKKYNVPIKKMTGNPSLYGYSSPSRAVKDELERLFRIGDKNYHLLKAAIKIEIRDRKARKKVKNFKELTLAELESCLKFAEGLYR